MIDFQTLWNNHPIIKDKEESPCSLPFDNQCAIRMGIALLRSGVKVTNVKKCWSHPGEGHILLAEQLANRLQYHVSDVGTANKRKLPEVISVDDYKSKKGIVFFKDFWARTKWEEKDERRFTGDHIDLWDGTQQTHGGDDYFSRSKQVWFWELA